MATVVDRAINARGLRCYPRGKWGPGQSAVISPNSRATCCEFPSSARAARSDRAIEDGGQRVVFLFSPEYNQQVLSDTAIITLASLRFAAQGEVRSAG